MSRQIISIFISIFMVTALSRAQPPLQTNETKPALNAEKLAVEWLARLNALGDWFISLDGKEQPEKVVSNMVELYAPDAIQLVGPSEDQIGTVMLRGTDAIRKWTDDFARSYVRLAYRIDPRTAKERTTTLIYSTPMPWGGLAVSFQITALYSLRHDRRTFRVPGAVFIEFREDGKIERLRLLLQKDEAAEIFP